MIGAFAFGSLVACGLSATATGGADDPDASASSPDGIVLDASVPEGSAQQPDCTGGITCGSTCTDPKSDPLNCGACNNACPSGESCDNGTCSLLCINDKQKCDGACVDLQNNPRHCGTCSTACQSGELCSSGACKTNCDMNLTRCEATLPGYCADTKTDHDNCGGCGIVCRATELCTLDNSTPPTGHCTSICASGVPVGDVYGPKAAPTMVGCVGTVNWKDRDTLCATGMTPCTPQQWNLRRGTMAPTYNYWTDADLHWYGSSRSCAAVDNNGGSCETFSSKTEDPMHVCASANDGAGNHCLWTGCGFNTLQNQYFGGCQGNHTAGTLCCSF